MQHATSSKQYNSPIVTIFTLPNIKTMAYTLQPGDNAIDFNLLATDGRNYSLSDFGEYKYLVLFFTCNHCPYVIGSDEVTRSTAEIFLKTNVGFAGINSNSENTYAEDSFPNMVSRMDKHKFPICHFHAIQ